MAALNRMRVPWTGAQTVGPSVSTFYFQAGAMAGMPAAIVSFFTSIRSFFPTGLSWAVPTSGDLLDDTTGTLLGGWSAPGGGVVTSNGGAVGWAMGVGVRARWDTAGIFRGRRVRGTTFLTSVSQVEFQTDGTPSTSLVGGVTSAGTALIAAAPTLAIWSRPTLLANGESNVVTACSVPDTISWLRSRRT